MIINSTLKENLLYSTNEDVDDSKILKLLSTFKIFNEESVSLDRKISNKSLSMGQMQKISFVRAILSGVEILILDESTSNLDEGSKKLIFQILQDLNITIINSTHNKEDFNNIDLHIEIAISEFGVRSLKLN